MICSSHLVTVGVHAVWREFALIPIALLLCGSAPRLFAQECVEVGIFLDYLSISQTNTNNFGVGGYRIHRKLMMEGELAYDYGINFHEASAARLQRVSLL